MSAEGDDDRLFFPRQHRRPWFLRPGRQVTDRCPMLPLGDRLLIDTVTAGQSPQALLTMLYRSTHRRCRGGAPMENLCHSASFDSCDKGAPSNSGIKHLARAPE